MKNIIELNHPLITHKLAILRDKKTGTKEFKYSDVLFGLNLQMLIYLAAMAEKGKVIPSGILYLPSSVPEISGEKNVNEEAIKKEKDKKLWLPMLVLPFIFFLMHLLILQHQHKLCEIHL